MNQEELINLFRGKLSEYKTGELICFASHILEGCSNGDNLIFKSKYFADNLWLQALIYKFKDSKKDLLSIAVIFISLEVNRLEKIEEDKKIRIKIPCNGLGDDVISCKDGVVH